MANCQWFAVGKFGYHTAIDYRTKISLLYSRSLEQHETLKTLLSKLDSNKSTDIK